MVKKRHIDYILKGHLIIYKYLRISIATTENLPFMKTNKRPESKSFHDEFDETWTMENALYILQHPTVDSKLWAEAVEWLLLNGPQEIKDLLLEASNHATKKQFPELTAKKYSPDGELCYDIAEIAKALEVEPEEVHKVLEEKERNHGIRHGFEDDDTTIIQ